MTKIRRTNWAQVLAKGGTAAAVLDPAGRIVTVTDAFSELTGWSHSDLVGRVCERISPSRMTAEQTLLSALAPSADVRGGMFEITETLLPTRAATAFPASLSFLPLSDEDGLCGFVVAIQAATGGKVAPSIPIGRQLHAEITALRFEMRQRHGLDTVIGQCSEIRQAVRQIQLLRTSDNSFTVVGRQGSGRQHFCRAVFCESPANTESLVIVNCRLMTAETLLNAMLQLQQIERTPSSAAPHQRIGMIVLADVAEMPREVQQWLVRDRSQRPTRGRICATSAETPADLVEQGKMLPEMAHLLSDVVITLPDLHQRGRDVSLLTQYFIGQMKRTSATRPDGASAEILQMFDEYRWPGNVAELRTVVEQACRQCSGSLIETNDAPYWFRSGQQQQTIGRADEPEEIPLEAMLERFEREMITKTLHAANGNRTETARRLGMTRPRLYRRLQQLGLDAETDAAVQD
ncbi:MAG: sigma 54-interacting transcriptional regulator [Planctomycetaceae bacterium]|nr:sigma 54-interacting transcriptional regulator [Planctomycetaceae bacterium]